MSEASKLGVCSNKFSPSLPPRLTPLPSSLQKKRDLEMIKSAVDELRKLNSAQSLRSIVGSQNLAEYQLSFAWDDSAVSFVGTGLHKVPLARLDYFFMTLGKGRLLMREVIRIIGPFPTVLNTLVGKASVEKGGEGSKDETLKVRKLATTSIKIPLKLTHSFLRPSLHLSPPLQVRDRQRC